MTLKIKTEDILGLRFGRTVIIDDLGLSATSIRMVLIQCDCGNTKRTYLSNLKRGITKSCGCYGKDVLIARSTTHGLSRHPLHSVWNGILNRCYNKNRQSYRFYGARGVTVCKIWRNNFKSFYDWAIANGWRKGLEIDRRDNKKGYTPNNCRFSDRKTQQRNTTTNTFYTLNGESKTLAEWCEIYGIDYKLTHQRIKRDGLSLAFVIANKGEKRFSNNKSRHRLSDVEVMKIFSSNDDFLALAKAYGVSKCTVYNIKKGIGHKRLTQKATT